MYIMNVTNVSLILLTLMYFLSGIQKVRSFNNVRKGLEQIIGLSELSKLMIIIAIMIELICPVIIIFSSMTGDFKEYATYALYMLILFTILATLLYHFPPIKSNYYPFMSNLTAIGGLLLATQTF